MTDKNKKGNIYKMSRKEKYENNSRRQQNFLSPEDIAAGRKAFWHGIEITGNVRNISPALWQFEHLTAVFINDNNLLRLPNDIGLLCNLKILDLSCNKLRSLPAELGELIHLRELLLNNNLLRVLPYEIGKLFHLQILGLHGNPLGKDVISIYNEPNGTQKLLTYLLDNLTDFGIALVQMNVTHDKEHNITHAIRLIRTAVQKYNPKIVVLPENFTFLYDKYNFDKYAEVIPLGETYVALSNIAKELRIYLVGGSIIERDDRNKNILYNTTMVFNPSGTMIAKHRKIHLSDMELDRDFNIRESDILKRGTTLTMFDVEGWKIGLGIGYDMSFTEMATLYRKNGVDLLIYPSAYPARLGLLHWDHLNRARAIDNQVFVVGVSPARDDTTDLMYYGHSMVVDPRGRVLVRAGDKEEIIYTDLEFMDVDKYRTQIKLFPHKRTDIYDTVEKY
ncbi:Omega-amidase NIT2 [Pseudolycoriella hygida]|uniref:omega-amidase n=1 Tax=Pseudolycoriella hygida TaxID=35572 RepID=A0A9Q0RZ50_9DIPT|nr:Omega-amidase NIT2 [Pseudolycoriella hygida]